LPLRERDQLITLANPRLIVGVPAEDHPERLCLSGALESEGNVPAPLPLVVSQQWKVTTSGGTTGVPKLIVTTTAADIDDDAKPDYLLPKDEVVLIPGPLYTLPRSRLHCSRSCTATTSSSTLASTRSGL
jgi:bile acid-coenzyme A ligase